MHQINNPYKSLTKPAIFNINLIALGIQFSWLLAIANMSGIYSYLGIRNDKLGLFWLIPSIIGLILPPFVGYFSDKTNTSFGRRLPYIFWGGILTAICLFIIPSSTNFLLIALIQCVFMIAINVAMHPMRALIGDIAPINLHTKLYAMQIALAGIGAVSASLFPWLILHLPIKNISHGLPFEIKLAFYSGALILMICSAWTTLATKRYLPLNTTNSIKTESQNLIMKLKNFYGEFQKNMPEKFMILLFMQFIIWMGVFGFMIYLTPNIGQTIFHLPSSMANNSSQYQKIVEQSTVLTGVCFSIFMAASVFFAYLIPILNKHISDKFILAFALIAGGVSLLSMHYIHGSITLLIVMIGIGISWASFNSIPFSLISKNVPSSKLGLYIGIFNIFVCLPQILVSGFAGLLVKNLWHGNVSNIISLSGVAYLLAGFLAITLSSKKIQIELN